jgi:hypothetical protein
VMFYILIITVIRHKNKDIDFAAILKSFTRTFSLAQVNLMGLPFKYFYGMRLLQYTDYLKGPSGQIRFLGSDTIWSIHDALCILSFYPLQCFNEV